MNWLNFAECLSMLYDTVSFDYLNVFCDFYRSGLGTKATSYYLITTFSFVIFCFVPLHSWID